MTANHDDPALCPMCRGSGVDPDDFDQPDPVLGQLEPCPDCDGRGEVTEP